MRLSTKFVNVAAHPAHTTAYAVAGRLVTGRAPSPRCARRGPRSSTRWSDSWNRPGPVPYYAIQKLKAPSVQEWLSANDFVIGAATSADVSPRSNVSTERGASFYVNKKIIDSIDTIRIFTAHRPPTPRAHRKAVREHTSTGATFINIDPRPPAPAQPLASASGRLLFTNGITDVCAPFESTPGVRVDGMRISDTPEQRTRQRVNVRGGRTEGARLRRIR
ncbi:hypothetical protein EVAR_80871_1 [Eumeta japonica]|uniref:Uncharacterized protein n=1 Tax=Eumeta variegata TaxID=151549 RepID=A0A4C1V060_EUMVA|nr:hypothetical protein EVAR_80871_1 [Eumeta japonica]